MGRPEPWLLPLHPGGVLPFDLGEIIYFFAFGVFLAGIIMMYGWDKEEGEGGDALNFPLVLGTLNLGLCC